jgi:hypothetical protein
MRTKFLAPVPPTSAANTYSGATKPAADQVTVIGWPV